MRKKKAPAQAPVQPVAVEIMAQLPDELREMLQKEQIRTLEDVTDSCLNHTQGSKPQHIKLNEA